jgi:hypothetical protein
MALGDRPTSCCTCSLSPTSKKYSLTLC